MLLVFCAVLLALGLREASVKKAAFGADYHKRPYDIAAPVLNVSPTKMFTFDLDTSIDFTKTAVSGRPRGAHDVTLNDVVQVFADPGLRQQIPAWIDQESDPQNRLVIRPPIGGIEAFDHTAHLPGAAPTGADPDANESVQLTSKDQWSGFKRYYIARYIDAQGHKLRRPVVTVFTVKGEHFALPAPARVSLRVASNGALDIGWNPVNGATEYEVVLVKGTPSGVRAENPDGGLQFSVLARTISTSINTKQFDSYDMSDALLAASNKVAQDSPVKPTSATQNTQFSGLYRISEDDVERDRAAVLETGGANPYQLDIKAFTTSTNARAAIAVVAVSGAGRSPLQFHDITKLTAQIPVATASLATTQLSASEQGAGESGSGGGADVRGQGSASGDASAQAGSGAPGAQAAQGPQALTMADGRTVLVSTDGKQTPFAYADKTDWSAFKEVLPAATMAQTPYPVNGSSDFVKFLASNLMAGNFYLDATKYLDDPKAPALYDALEEAAAQNPYILYDNLSASRIDQGNKHLLYISSFYEIKDWKSLQQQMWEKVQAVDAQIITAGMSNEEKARAINAWLVNNANYDMAAYYASTTAEKKGAWDIDTAKLYYEAYSYAQNATGVLLKGKGVCASYAAAFKALADVAELSCVYVTGTLKSSDEGHAWNKVDLSGRWLIVDSAWNDASGSLLRYFGLTDNSALADRVQDQSFMVDAYIPQYAN